MKKSKKLLPLVITVISILICCCTVFCGSMVTNKEEVQVKNATERTLSLSEEDIDPQGLMVKLSLNISTENGKVIATAKNTFTLFPATVWVYIELYYSETYQESYTTMQLVASHSTRDLNMGESIVVSSPTFGRTLYWQARMRYKVDSNDWASKTTSTFLFDSDGNEIIC